MSEHRFEVRALIDPARNEGPIEGAALRLVTVELLDGAGVVDDLGRPAAKPPVRCSVRPDEARELAFCLLAAAERAERPGGPG
jgi:hypothetical protein